MLRLVQSGFGSGAEFDGEFESTFGGWHTFLAMLRAGVKRFPDGANVTVFRMATCTHAEAWERMQQALAITSTVEGSNFVSVVGEGVVTRNAKPGYLCLSMRDSVLGVFVEGSKTAMITLQWILFGDAAKRREEVREMVERLVDAAENGPRQ